VAPLVLILGFGFINPKLLILVLPFVLIGCVGFAEWLITKKQLCTFFTIVSLVMFLGFGFMVVVQPPTQSDWVVVEAGVKASVDEDVQLFNDWEEGYWLLWKDGRVKSGRWGGGQNPFWDSSVEGIYVTNQELEQAEPQKPILF